MASAFRALLNLTSLALTTNIANLFVIFFLRSIFMSSMNLYVGNMSYHTTESDLRDLFAAYGEVESAKIVTDRYTGQSKGFGFVEMSSRSEGEKAIAELNGKEIDSRQVKVNEAKPRTDNRGGGGYGGRGSRY
jgi:RNA recognition motif-containing protein